MSKKRKKRNAQNRKRKQQLSKHPSLATENTKSVFEAPSRDMQNSRDKSAFIEKEEAEENYDKSFQPTTIKTAGATASGSSHKAKKMDCQDRLKWKIQRVDGTEILVAALADGAGTSSKADVGAQLAVDAFVDFVFETVEKKAYIDFVFERLGSNISLKNLLMDRRFIKKAFGDCRSNLVNKAQQEESDLEEYSTTLIGLILVKDENGSSSINIAGIGDSVSILVSNMGFLPAAETKDFQACFVPISRIEYTKARTIRTEQLIEIIKGEYANETVFLTSPNWEDFFSSKTSDSVCGVVLASDGLNYIYFKQVQTGLETSHDSKFIWQVIPDENMIARLLNALAEGKLTDSVVSELLENNALSEINADDKSLLVVLA